MLLQRAMHGFRGSCIVGLRKSAVRWQSTQEGAATVCQTTPARNFVPLRSISQAELGTSVLSTNSEHISLQEVRQGSLLSPRMVLAAKILSLSSSALGLAMIPVMSKLVAQKPGASALAAIADSFFILYALTPVLLHQILVKRYIVDLYYNPETETFTSVHYGFFLGKKALRFRSEDVVDANLSPDMFKLYFPLATAVIHGKPMMLSLLKESYISNDIYNKLTKNIKTLPEKVS